MNHRTHSALLILSCVLAACGGGSADEPSSLSTVSAELGGDDNDTVPADTAGDVQKSLAAEPSADSDVAQPAMRVEAPDDGPSKSALAADAAPATVFLYVATTGSDTNPGTKLAPFKTIAKAASVAKPGTTVYVASGAYAGGFVTATSGTPTAPIRYVSSTRWGAKIVPPANSKNSIGWRNLGDHVDIVAFEIDGTLTQGGMKWRNGVAAVGSYNRVANNHVHHIAQADADCVSSGGSGINSNTYEGGFHNEISGNVVHHIGAVNCKYFAGIYMSTSGSVHNNLVYGNGNWGIQTWHDAANLTISHNTVVKNGKGILVGGGGYYKLTGPADYINVANNIVSGNTKYCIMEQGEVGTHNDYANNLCHQNGIVEWAVWKNPHRGDVNADPQFVDFAGGDYRLKSTSPALDRGLSIYSPVKDLLGMPRPQGNGFDLGAYEFQLN